MNAKFTSSILVALFSAAVFAQQSNSGYASMTINGVDGPPFPILNVNVRTSLPAYFGFAGASNQPYLVFQGPAIAVGSAFLPSNVSFNSVDLTLNPFPVIVIDGFAYPFFSTDFTGTGGFAITLPPSGNPPNGIPLGIQLALQALLLDPFSNIGFTLTAATRITVTQGPTITNMSLGDENTQAVSVPSMPIPFYGANYTTLYVNANGYVMFGTNGGSDFTPSESEFAGGPPRMAGFWTDLDQVGGTITSTVDTPQGGPGGTPGFVRIDYTNVEGWTVSVHHSFSMLMRTDGYLEIIYPTTQNASIYDEITGIGPGSGLPHPQKNYFGPQPVGSTIGPGILSTPPYAMIGNANESFIEWFGTTNGSMPYYGNPYDDPFDLFARTLHFLPSGSGSLPASTNAYTLY